MDSAYTQGGSAGAAGIASPNRPGTPAADFSAAQLPAFTRRAEMAKPMLGKQIVPVDPRKRRYDIIRGMSGKRYTTEVTRDDRMSYGEAAAALHSIHEMFGLAGEAEDVLAAHDEALWFCHTVNGGSVLNPGRSTYTVAGVTQVFSYAHVRDKLGVNFRRFFRSFADDIARANQKVLDQYDPGNPAAVEAYGWLMEVATKRNLARFPHLAHDSSDACLGLGMAERAALAAAKSMVVGSVPNTADNLDGNSRTQAPAHVAYGH